MDGLRIVANDRFRFVDALILILVFTGWAGVICVAWWAHDEIRIMRSQMGAQQIAVEVSGNYPVVQVDRRGMDIASPAAMNEKPVIVKGGGGRQ